MENYEYESLQCYVESLPLYYQLDSITKRAVKHQYGIHGLRYCNYRDSTTNYSQEELLLFLKPKYGGNKDILGYKGGNIESKLCEILGISALNLEHFSVEKYNILIDLYRLDIKRCRF